MSSKTIELSLLYHKQVEAGLIELRQIPDEANDADVLTKIITGRPFKTKARRLLGSEMVLDPSE